MVNVIDTKEPARKAWQMSEEGYQELNTKYPKQYQVVTQPTVVVVQKKRVDVPVAVKVEASLPDKKGKRGNPESLNKQ